MTAIRVVSRPLPLTMRRRLPRARTLRMAWALVSLAGGQLAAIPVRASELLSPANAGPLAEEQVTSINQFGDVKPTDWAYQALSNLIERYGCVAGYPNGTLKGGRAISRFEAAVLLHACLERVTETTDGLKKLLNEFQNELAILKGRADGLDARVGVLEANQFSTTTKLSVLATMVVGGVSNNPAGSQVSFNVITNI